VDADSATPEEWTVLHIMLQRAKAEQLRAMQSGMMGAVHLRPEGSEG
jgi:hypothetical protein